MSRYIIRRLLSAIPVVFLLTAVVFFLMQVLPGDPVLSILGEQATPEATAKLREQLGLNRPVHIRYVDWLLGLPRGDLGKSLRDGKPVAEVIGTRLPATLELAAFSALWSILIGIGAGVIAAIRRNSLLDSLTSTTALLGICIPGFWLGILLMIFFSINLRWLPSTGFVPFFDDPTRNLQLMILPSITLGAAWAPVLVRLVRSSMIEVMQQEYIRTAWSKGLRELIIIRRHALKNAIIPTVTMAGVMFARLLGGSLVIESVFAFPGIGKLTVDSVLGRDYTIVQGVILIMVLAVVISNLVVDILYAYLDPRIRYS